MKRLNNCRDLFKVISTADPQLRSAIIKHGPKKLIDAYSEICLNILNGNLKVPKNVHSKLKPFKHSLRQMSTSKTSVAKRRKVLNQRGGFLLALLGSLISGVVGSLFHKN